MFDYNYFIFFLFQTQEDTAMGGLNSGPGPGLTLFIAIFLLLAQTVLTGKFFSLYSFLHVAP